MLLFTVDGNLVILSDDIGTGELGFDAGDAWEPLGTRGTDESLDLVV